MNAMSLSGFSEQLADLVDRASASVVQVQGRRRPASGVVLHPDLVVTTTRAIGQERGLRLRTSDGTAHDAELRGWDPATGLSLLKVTGAPLQPFEAEAPPPRTGHLIVGIARSWSNVVTATSGIVAIVGGPLPTGPGRAIERVMRTTAPMHGGFAGGAVLDVSGRFAGVATAQAIRGLAVVIPADIVGRVAARLAEHGTPRRGYLGIAGQAVRLPPGQQDARSPQRGLLIVGISPESPAERAGLMVGDVIVRFDAQAVESPVDLLALLDDGRVGREVGVRLLRGGSTIDATVIVGTRPHP
ncbi:MAG: serine protease [Acidobacteria bacterium]|nr:serine protease [Acidobacteriota bacterium]